MPKVFVVVCSLCPQLYVIFSLYKTVKLFSSTSFYFEFIFRYFVHVIVLSKGSGLQH